MYKIYNKTNNRFLVNVVTKEVMEYSTVEEARQGLKDYIECEYINQGRLAVFPSDSKDIFEIMQTNISETIRPEPTVKTGVNLVNV